jgi:hypothetical protein
MLSTLEEAIEAAVLLANDKGLMGQRGRVVIVPPASVTHGYSLAWMDEPMRSASEPLTRF